VIGIIRGIEPPRSISEDRLSDDYPHPGPPHPDGKSRPQRLDHREHVWAEGPHAYSVLHAQPRTRMWGCEVECAAGPERGKGRTCSFLAPAENYQPSNSFSHDGFLHPKPPWNSGSNSRQRYRKLGLRWRLAPRNRGRKSGFSVALGVLATSLTARYVPCWQEARGHWAITRVRSSLFRDGWR